MHAVECTAEQDCKAHFIPLPFLFRGQESLWLSGSVRVKSVLVFMMRLPVWFCLVALVSRRLVGALQAGQALFEFLQFFPSVCQYLGLDIVFLAGDQIQSGQATGQGR